MDEGFGGWLRKRKDKVILVANKCEGRAGQQGLAEAHGLGLGEPLPVSAEPGEGLSDLHEALPRDIAPKPREDDEKDEGIDDTDQQESNRPLPLRPVSPPTRG